MPPSLLEVFWAGKLAGTLCRTEEGTWFEYDRSFGSTHLHGGGIAFNLPRDRGPFFASGESVHPFFAGLLPSHSSAAFAALAKIGTDLPGCVAVLAPGASPSLESAPLRPLNESDLVEEIALRQDEAIALPGAAPKLHLPNEAAFIKIGPSGRPFAVENELRLLHLAHLCGIRTVAAHLVRDRSGRTGLRVSRFDRRGLQRIHQESGFQLLNAHPHAVSTSLMELASALQGVVSNPKQAMRELLQRVVFGYLVGNSEFHPGKVSVYEPTPGQWELTPAYGLRTTLPYTKLRRNMALRIGNHDDNFSTKDFVTLFERHLLTPTETRQQILSLTETLGNHLGELDQIGFEPKTTHGIRRVIEHRLARLVG